MTNEEIKKLSRAARERDVGYLKANQESISELINDGYFAGQKKGSPQTDKYVLAHRLAWLAAQNNLNFERAIKKQLIVTHDEISKAVLSGKVSTVKYALSKQKSVNAPDLGEATIIAIFTKQPADILALLDIHTKYDLETETPPTPEYVRINRMFIPRATIVSDTEMNRAFMDVTVLEKDIIRLTRLKFFYTVLKAASWSLVAAGLMAGLAGLMLIPLKVAAIMLSLGGAVLIPALSNLFAFGKYGRVTTMEEVISASMLIITIVATLGLGLAAALIPGLIPAFIITVAVLSFVTNFTPFLISNYLRSHKIIKQAENDCVCNLEKHLDMARKQYRLSLYRPDQQANNQANKKIVLEAEAKLKKLDEISPGIKHALEEHFKQRTDSLKKYVEALDKDSNLENISKNQQLISDAATQLNNDLMEILKGATKGPEAFCEEVIIYLRNFETAQKSIENTEPYVEYQKPNLTFSTSNITEHIAEIAIKNNLKL